MVDNRPKEESVDAGGLTSSSNARNLRSAEFHAFLCDMAREGDIILPVDQCISRRGETFKQWTERKSTIEVARQERVEQCKGWPDDLALLVRV